MRPPQVQLLSGNSPEDHDQAGSVPVVFEVIDLPASTSPLFPETFSIFVRTENDLGKKALFFLNLFLNLHILENNRENPKNDISFLVRKAYFKGGSDTPVFPGRVVDNDKHVFGIDLKVAAEIVLYRGDCALLLFRGSAGEDREFDYHEVI